MVGNDYTDKLIYRG